MVALLGGLLGVLMMIPLRHGLIVKEHGKLTYPEGTACADVLIVGEKGGTEREDRLPGLRRRPRLRKLRHHRQAVVRRPRRSRSSFGGALQGRHARGRGLAAHARRRLHHRPAHRRAT